MALGAILSTANDEPLGAVSTCVKGDLDCENATRELLREWWEVTSKGELLDSVEWLTTEGHNQAYEALREGIRRGDISSEPGDDSEMMAMIAAVQEAEKAFPKQGILAWDYVRALHLARWGVGAGYLTEAEGWQIVERVDAKMRESFSSYRELGQNYLLGRRFWAKKPKDPNDRYEQIYQKLVQPEGLWARLPW
ncbi:MAG: DUF1266 domain-containing protein [Deltaproteobacteria bacterium]|nr:DUF1266 domain-containing protein [Deltaproteobacteria bacterium]